MTPFSQNIADAATQVLEAARAKKLRIVTAESCTGGLIASALTEIAGSSDVFDRGFISYSYDAKMAQLDVARKTITDFGAVSGETVLEMVQGALRNSHADVAVAVTGIAGPGGATDGKPVGLVYVGVSNNKNGEVTTQKFNFTGDRSAVRKQTVEAALDLLKKEIDSL